MIPEPAVSNAVSNRLLACCHRYVSRWTRVAAWPDVLFCAAIFVLLYFRVFAFPAIPYVDITTDVGLFLNDAFRMLQGQTLYRDFCELNFPGTFVAYYWIMKVVGVRAWIAPAVLMLIGLVLTRITLAFSRRLFSGPIAYLPTLFFIAFGFRRFLDATHHWFSVVLVSSAAVVLLGGPTNPRRLALVGTLCGAAAWFTQTRGALAVLAFSLFLYWDYNRQGRGRREMFSHLSWLLGFFCLTLALLLGYHVAAVGPRLFFAETILFPLTNYSKYAGVNSFDIFGTDLALASFSPSDISKFLEKALLYLLSPGIFVLAFVRLYRTRYRVQQLECAREERRALTLAIVLGLFLFLGIANSADSSRLAYDSYFGFLLLVWFCKQEPIGRLLLSALVSLSAITMLSVFHFHPSNVVDLPSGRAAYWFDFHQDSARWVRDHTTPGDYVYFEASDEYYLFGVRNPTPIAFLTNTGYTRPADVHATVEGLERHRVRYLLMRDFLNAPLGELNVDYLQELRPYIANHYRLTRSFESGLQLWERSSSGVSP